MNRQRPDPLSMRIAHRRPLWLAAADGRRLPPRHERLEVGAIDGPETPLPVEFVGLTEAEQRAALAAFPGGKRFVLVPRSN